MAPKRANELTLSTSASWRASSPGSWFGFLVIIPGLFLGGCAGYQLGPTNGLAPREKSVQINPFVNQTIEPRLSDAVTSQLRKSLQQDGTYELASKDNGDIVVSGVLTVYHRRELSLVPQDLVTARDYRVTLTAQVTARDRSTGKIIFD